MSDLIGGGQTSAANGRGNHGGRAQGAPGIPASPTIKGPREVMRERAAREARRKAEQDKEAMERARAEEEAMLLEDARRASAERRAAAGAVQQRGSGDGQRVSGGTIGQRISDNSQRSNRQSGDRVNSGGDPNQPLQGIGRGGRAVGGGDSAPVSRPRPTQSNQQPRTAPESSRTRPAPAQPASAAPAPGPANTQGESKVTTATRSSFPHAFERWETLSAHWEGLTSFWIRRLEENSNEINRDPLSQQLSRQVTDLSAAGANLFHAVVELQRLRASSERKFQRWFFETRAEQERAQEIQAMTEASLENERRERASAINEAVEKERERSNVDKQLAEMKRELQISKEEARRAWEELGRREQEERARTTSLREGQPTVLGGVQVVPMMQGVPSRHGSARDVPPARDGPYPSGQPTTQEPKGQADNSDIAYQQYAREQRAEPADPFVDTEPNIPVSQSRSTAAPGITSPVNSHPQEYSQAPAVQATPIAAFYQQNRGTFLHPVDDRGQTYGPSVPSEGAFSEEEYEIDPEGHFMRDAAGNKIRYPAAVSDADTDEYDVASERGRELANLERYGQISGVEYGSGPTATAAPAPPGNPGLSEPDYTGQGYGSAPEWAAVPRHHHPTRLSDVLEEDERSRTSASQVSRRE